MEFGNVCYLNSNWYLNSDKKTIQRQNNSEYPDLYRKGLHLAYSARANLRWGYIQEWMLQRWQLSKGKYGGEWGYK